MLGSLVTFVEELREIGIPVSMVEALDAARALEHTDLADREAFRASLGATLVKNERHQAAFDTAFDVFYGLALPPAGEGDGDDAASSGEDAGEAAGGGGGEVYPDELFEAIVAALISDDRETLRVLARQAVAAFSGIQPGRPVGGRYYFYRVMRRLGAEALVDRLLAAVGEAGDATRLDERLQRSAAEARAEQFRSEVRQEIVRRLVADRGPEAVAQTLRSPLVEDIDLMHATREELRRIEAVVAPLARKLATRTAQRRRRGRKGRLDARRTIRRSLEHGGALLDPKFRPPRRSKPELVLLCDVSGSMATFARFTLQLTYAIAHQFSRVRAFAFVDGIDEVTDYFRPGVAFHDAIVDMTAGAHLVWRDGHSDYGNALEAFASRFPDAITARSTVIVTGDARTNYRNPRTDLVEWMAKESRALYWLNPESKRYWDTGDSVMSAYAPACTDVVEVRTLRQLEHFVEQVAVLGPVRRSVP